MLRRRFVLALAALGACDQNSDLPGDPDGGGFADAQVVDGTVFPDADPGPFCQLPELPCPAPMSGLVTVCGRVHDAESSMPVRPAGKPPYAVAATGAAGFAIDPGKSPPPDQTTDPCGRFVLTDVAVPVDGRIVVYADDTAAGEVDDVYRTTAVLVNVAADQQLTGVFAFLTRQSSNDAWSSSAGMTTTSFADEGAILSVFMDLSGFPTPPWPGRPSAGVLVVRDGSGAPDEDFYFSNSDKVLRTTIGAGLSATGMNGSALVVGGETAELGGLGGEPVGGHWPATAIAPIRGVVQVLPILAVCP